MEQILHHGAVNGVTGSCHEVRIDDGDHRAGILIDCGLFQGAETSGSGADQAHQAIDFPIDHIRALVVTHCHIDHVGRIPYLLAAGFKGPILCSRPTAELLPLVLEDAVRVGFTRDRDLVERFIGLLRRRLQPLDYGQWHAIDLGPGFGASLQVRLQPAGHILGSAYVQCRIERQGRRCDLLFSGDLGGPYTPLLPAPRPPYGADLLVIESTYGDRRHGDRSQRVENLRQVVEQALRDRGTLLIPAFSIGRTQELLYELESLIHRQGRRHAAPGLPWNELEIIVDSPLAARFTEAYRRLRPWWDAEAKRRWRSGRHPLAFEQLLTIDSHEDHLRTVDYLSRSGRPAVVIAASGMCAGGRIVNYLKAMLPEPRNDVAFVGYQARGTPGRDIQQYGPRGGYVMLDGQRIDIRARIHTLPGYSAHADQQGLVNFVKRMRRKPGEIRIVHGDDEAKKTLAAKLAEVCPEAFIHVPTSA